MGGGGGGGGGGRKSVKKIARRSYLSMNSTFMASEIGLKLIIINIVKQIIGIHDGLEITGPQFNTV